MNGKEFPSVDTEVRLEDSDVVREWLGFIDAHTVETFQMFF